MADLDLSNLEYATKPTKKNSILPATVGIASAIHKEPKVRIAGRRITKTERSSPKGFGIIPIYSALTGLIGESLLETRLRHSRGARDRVKAPYREGTEQRSSSQNSCEACAYGKKYH